VVKLWSTLRRGKFKKEQPKLKTEASRKGVVILQELADVLLAWRSANLCRTDEDWVFASEVRNGAEPVWLDIVLHHYVQPAAVVAKITKKVGWHNFRRALATLLATKGESVKVVQELLRRPNSSVTLQLYPHGDKDLKRAAQGPYQGPIPGPSGQLEHDLALEGRAERCAFLLLLKIVLDALLEIVPFECPCFSRFQAFLSPYISFVLVALEMVGTAGFEPTTSTV
jgi:hypothetical protein